MNSDQFNIPSGPVLGVHHNRRVEGHALYGLGNIHSALGQTREAIGYNEQSLAIVREIGDRRGEGYALGNLGLNHAELGHSEKAVDLLDQAVRIGQAIDDPRLVNLYSTQLKELRRERNAEAL